jgi:hypothetical protein
MSDDTKVQTPEEGFGSADFELLQRIGDGDEPDAATSEAAEALWTKAERLAGRLGAGLFDERGFHASVWPDRGDGERGPFLWARLKRAGNEAYATHIGVFLSPGFCNLSLDLEKDPLDAGQAGETLEQVLAFYRDGAAALLDPPVRPDLRVWTDTNNVVTPADFAGVDFDAFLAANRDAGHPWPKAGYLLNADLISGFGNDWLRRSHARADALVPIYDAMIRSFGG